MGGRGSTLAHKHIYGKDNNPNRKVNWNDPESEYHNKMFNLLKEEKVSTRKSTDDIDDKIFERQQRQVLSLASEYKKALKTTTQNEDIQLGSEQISGGTLGYCACHQENGEFKQRVVLDKKLYTDYDHIRTVVEDAVSKKHFAPINTRFKSRDYIVTHELGHAVENSIVVKLAKDRGMNIYTDFRGTSNKLEGEIKNEIIKIYQKDFAKDNALDKIFLSRYSRKDDGEWFAETFANLHLSDNPEPIALALQKYLRRFK